MKTTILHSFTFALMVFFAGAGEALAQGADSLFGQFESRFVLLDSIIHRPHRVAAAGDFNPEAFGRSVEKLDAAFADSVIDNSVSAQLAAARSVTGITVNGQIYGRLDEGFGLDEDDALSRYKAKVQADVRWNIFGSALMNRKGKANELRLKGEIEKLNYRRENIGRLVAAQKEQFRLRYDSLLSGVLAHRIENLTIIYDALTYLLNDGGIASDDLLQVLNDKAEAERLMATIANPAPATADLSIPGSVIVSVDSVRLLQFIGQYNVETSSLILRQQLLEQQAANTTYWTTLNVSPYLRYSYYVRPVIDNSSNIDAGFSFIIPISGETGKKRRALLAEKEVLALENDRLTAVIADNIRLTLLDIDRMNRSITGEVKRLEELRDYLILRRMAYDGRIGEYNYLARMKEYNAYILCCERLLSFSYQRDCMLASLQNYLPDVSILSFCSESNAGSSINK